MYGYKTAEITTEEFNVVVDLKLNGDWEARNSDDYNMICELPGLETALSRALESDDGVGQNKKQTVTVRVFS